RKSKRERSSRPLRHTLVRHARGGVSCVTCEGGVMKRAVLSLVLAGSAFAQLTSPTGFGRQLYPGTGGPTVRGGVLGPGFGGAECGGVVFRGAGAPAFIRNGSVLGVPPSIGHRSHSGGLFAPFPVFYGGGYYDAFEPPPAATPYSEYDLNYPGQRAPV